MSVRAVLLAAAGAVGYGAFLIGLAASEHSDPIAVTILARVGAVIVAAPLAIRVRTRSSGPPLGSGAAQMIVAIGVLDAVGVLAFAVATAHSNAAVTAVLASLYPAVTVALAVRYKADELAPLQRFGIALTLVAIPLLAAS